MTLAPRDRYRLYDKACAGTLDDADQAALSATLLADPAFRKEYLDYCRMHTELSFDIAALAAQQAAEAALDPSPTQPAVLPSALWRSVAYLSQPLRFSVLFATVAIVSLLLTSAQIFVKRDVNQARVGDGLAARDASESKPHSPARVLRTVQCRWEGGVAPQMGDELPLHQRLTLTAGQAEFAFRDGARVILAAPLVCQITAADVIELQSGRICVQVPTQASGFRVVTPQAKIIDLGTEFAVAVDSSAADATWTETHVFTGEVEVVTRTSGATGRWNLRAGQALRIAADGAAQLTAEPEQFVRALPQVDELIRLSNLNWRTEPFDHLAELSDDEPRSSARPMKLGLTTEGIESLTYIHQRIGYTDLGGRQVTGRVYLRHNRFEGGEPLVPGSAQRVDLRLLFDGVKSGTPAIVDVIVLTPDDPTDRYLAREVTALAPEGARGVTLAVILRTDAPQQHSGAVLIDDASLTIAPPPQSDAVDLPRN